MKIESFILSIQEKLVGENVHINRILLVDQEYRQQGVGAFLLQNSIQDGVRDGLSAYYYPAVGRG